MKRIFTVCILSCAGISVTALAQHSAQAFPQAAHPVLSEPAATTMKTAAAGDAFYELPAGLSILGTHNAENQPVCNFLSFNKETNKGYFLWAPIGKKVTYTDNTANGPTAWNWASPGTAEQTVTDQHASVTYTKIGHYDFPTLTATTANGKSTYKAEGQILVSGKAEISAANCRKWGETYQTGHLPLQGSSSMPNPGYIGGTNATGISGYGNLFMTAHGGANITGVNVYFPFKPTKYEENAQLLLRVWYPTEDNTGNMKLDGLPLEFVYLPVSEIREARENETPIQGAAVGEFRFEEPLEIWDKPLFFVTVEGFGTDTEKNDICMLTELMGQRIPQEELTNLLAHNSFVNYNNLGYTTPINYFGTNPGASFMICPIIDNQDGDATVAQVTQKSATTSIHIDGSQVTAENPYATEINVISLQGIRLQSAKGTSATFNLPEKGLYFVQVIANGTQTDVRKIMIN